MNSGNKAWYPFYFDTNKIWKLVSSQEDWQEVVEVYHGDLEVLKSACNALCREPDITPKFGFRSECCGKLTLEKWAKANGMDLFK